MKPLPLALLMLALGLLVGALWTETRWTDRQRRWTDSTTALLTDLSTQHQTHTAVLTDSLTRIVADRDRLRQIVATAQSAVRQARDSLRHYAEAVQRDTTLAACQANAAGAVRTCERALATAEAATEAAVTEGERRVGEVVRVAAERDSVRQERIWTLERQLRTAPVGERRMLGFLPMPRIVVGIGCSAGWKGGCGLSVTAGIPLGR